MAQQRTVLGSVGGTSASSSSPSSGADKKPPGVRTVQQIDLAYTQVLFDYYLHTCSYVNRHQALVAKNVFQEQDFHVIVGDPGVDIAHLNTPAFKSALAQLLMKADLCLHGAHLAIFRIVRDRARAYIEHMKRGGDGGDAFAAIALPIDVEPFDADRGTLYRFVMYTNEVQWHYEPANERDARAFYYVVYHDMRGAPLEPVPVATFLNSLDESTRRLFLHIPSFQLRNQTFAAAGSDQDDRYVLPSPLWEGFARRRQLDEVMTNIMDAEHLSSHPPAFTLRRPAAELNPGLISADSLQRAQSLGEAGVIEMQRIAMMNYQNGALAMQVALSKGQPASVVLDKAVRGTDVRRLKDVFARPDVRDDILDFPEVVASFSHAVPSYRQDPEALRYAYAEHVCMLLDGWPVSDMFANYGATNHNKRRFSTAASMAGSAGSTDETALHNQREATVRQKRHAFNDLFAWVYRHAFADTDMVVLGDLMDTFNARQHAILRPSLNRAKTLTQKERRQLLMQLLRSKRAPSEASLSVVPSGSGGGGGGRSTTTNDLASVSELRDMLMQRIQLREPLEGSLVFDAEVQQETEMKAMREHEWLDPTIHEMRTKELDMVGQWVAAGIVKPESLVRLARDLLDVELEVAALVPENKLPGLLPAPKKRPKPDDGTVAQDVLDEQQEEEEEKKKKKKNFKKARTS